MTSFAPDSAPIMPRPTAVEAKLERLPDIRAVLFDIYGTLLISASGDVGVVATQSREGALIGALQATGLQWAGEPDDILSQFDAAIRESHQATVARGIEYPEVDIVEIWRTTLSAPGYVAGPATKPLPGWQQADYERFALEFELRVNPVWPMPGFMNLIAALGQRNLQLGVVSNAQFYTPLLFPALVGKSLAELGCNRELFFYSYEHGWAKPGRPLFQTAKNKLQAWGIVAKQTLFVGNDMLNDVAAAMSVGFQTALFAGDQRSLRWRAGDPRVAGVQPTIVLTELAQLTECLS